MASTPTAADVLRQTVADQCLKRFQRKMLAFGSSVVIRRKREESSGR
jgi:hypothetical protein